MSRNPETPRYPDLIMRPLLEGGRICAYTTERGAEEVASPHAGFSLCGYAEGASPGHVAACRRRLAEALGLVSPDCIVTARQTHSLNVAIADGPLSEAVADTDALVTSTPGIVVGVNTADCVPLILADPEARVVAAVHSGWRGTAGRISARAVEAMTTLGAEPKRIRAVCGPSICPDCFEVGPEVAARFADLDALAGGGVVVWPGGRGARPHVDLRRAIAATLVAAGLESSNIAATPWCSRCDSSRFFSARRLGVASGRTFTFVVIRP